MQGNTIRSIGVFAVIGIILVGLVVGSLQFAKAREKQYASKQPQTVATTQQPTKASEQKPKTEEPTAPNPSSSDNTQPAASNPAASTPAPATPSQSQPVQTTPNAASVPSTGPSIGAVVSIFLMATSVYLGLRIKRIRQSYLP